MTTAAAQPTNQNPTIRVMVVDDHDLVRTGIRHLLDEAEAISVVAEASSGEEAVRLARDTKPNVVLMDVKMPGIGGLEATKKLLRFDASIRILVVTVCDDDLFPVKLLQAGAFGYLTKGASMQEMIRAIKTVFAGQRYISPDIASQLAIRHVTDNGDSPFEALSDRELEVALLITIGTKVQAIATKLNLSAKTVNSYRYRIFDKLDVNNDVELTHLAIRHGLVDGYLYNSHHDINVTG